jgi:hypothetical protein
MHIVLFAGQAAGCDHANSGVRDDAMQLRRRGERCTAK